MKNPLAALFALLLSLLATPVLAAETVSFSFNGCTDTMNRPIASRAEPGLASLVDVQQIEGNRVIVYNPSMMPQLLPETRAFFYAHACAITRLGLPIDRERTAEQTRRADCWAFDTLRRSGLLKGNAAEGIQTDMEISPEVWPMVPGGPRTLDPALCKPGAKIAAAPKAGEAKAAEAGGATAEVVKGNALSLDKPNASPAWNACTQSCGNRLFSCGRGSSCQATFDQCVKGCAGK